MRKIWELIQSGKLAEAERRCQGVLSEIPDLKDARFAMGVIEFHKGDKDASLAHLETVLAVDPDHLGALGLASQILLDFGRHDRALEMGRRAYELRPKEGPMLLLHLTGRSFLAQNRPLSALNAFKALVGLNPKLPAGYVGEAEAFIALGSTYDAILALNQAAESEATKGILVKLAGLELTMGRPGEAERAAAKALSIDPSDTEALVIAGQSLIEQGKREDSQSFWNRALDSTEDKGWVEQKQGHSLAMMGRSAEAEVHLRRSIALQPKQGLAYQTLFAGKKTEESDRPVLERLDSYLTSDELTLPERAPLAFGLGKAWDDLGEPERCFKYFDLGHAAQEAMLDRAFDPDKIKEQFELQKRLFSEAPPPAPEIDSPQPIFVLGMMRSGTTLVEQILSAHSRAKGAGELDFWTGSEPLLVDRSEPRFVRELAEERRQTYRQLLSSVADGKEWVVDKNPGNLNVAGMLRYVVPNAKIVYVRRNPLDVAVSIWSTYSNPYSPFTVKRIDVVAAVAQSLTQGEYWGQILPANRFLELRYEDLVSDPETSVRRLLEFCGLTWEDRCLRPDETHKKVSTPSLWQVRQPLNISAVGRWKRFEPWLGQFSALADLNKTYLAS